MWAYVVTIFMAGITFFFMPFQNTPNPGHTSAGKNQALAQEFLEYRATILKYAYENPSVVGVIPHSNISFPPTLKLSGTWTHNIVPGREVYVYGPNIAGLPRVLTDKANDSIAIGVNRGGAMHCPKSEIIGVSVPAFVPDGYIVSVAGR